MDDIILQCEHVCQEFVDPCMSVTTRKSRILFDVDLTVVRGEFIGLVGPSGCGKSTLLRTILGTNPPSSGRVLVDGVEVTGPNRDVGVVYQKYGLYDFFTAQQNVACGPIWDTLPMLKHLHHPLHCWKMRKEYMRLAHMWLHKLKLDGSADKFPCELSGGMQQRVAIAGALIMRPKILLLDEPFGALDEATREGLQKMLLVLYAENMEALKHGKQPPHTVVLVTHELNEAFYCCDRVIGLSRNWRDVINGKELLGPELGATKVFDKAGPTYRPDDPRNFERFSGLISDLRRVVFGQKIQDRFENVTFWDDLQNGVGAGVALDWSERNEIPDNADAR